MLALTGGKGSAVVLSCWKTIFCDMMTEDLVSNRML